jgi:hypothetical protein
VFLVLGWKSDFKVPLAFEEFCYENGISLTV